jgi:hypothetical protein
VIDATIALAALDNEVKRAGADLIVAVQQQDMRMFLGASDGLRDLARESIPNAQRLLIWPDTQAAGEAYLPVLCGMEAAASDLSAALRAGNGQGVTDASGLLATAVNDYRGIRSNLVDLADIALVMKRGLLVK